MSMFRLTATFLLLSGVASLTYQVVWVRLLGLSMGSTSASISTVLAAFFLGLAIGSYLAERITRNRIDNLQVYIYLEMIIGISGLVLLPVLLNLDSLIASVPVLGATIAMKFVVVMALLTLPTICMGATFPVMASLLIRRRNEVGLRVGQLYSLNTAGAVLGAALAGFVFIPNWGLDGAIYIACSINALIVVLGLYLNNRISLPPLDTQPVLHSGKGRAASMVEEAPLRGRALIVLFCTGLVAIAIEVGWTKYLSIFTGTTIYGFAAILTIFLLGISAGSWAIKSYLEQMRRPEFWMAFGLIVLGLTLLLTRAGLSLIPPVYEAINHLPASAFIRHGVKYLFVFLLLFPPTFVFGALFPLNLKLYCGNLQGVRARIGKAYAVNTVASIFGSLMAGFWIIPQFGTDMLLTSMALVILVLPFLFVPVLRATGPRVAIPALAMLVISGNWILPHISYKDLIASVQYQFDVDAIAGKVPEFLYLKEGKAGVISMVTYDGKQVKLQNNGLNESFIDLENDKNVLLIENLLGLIPYMLHDDPKSAFVVGFGGGITTRALTFSGIESIKVVELEPAVVEAGRAIVGGEIPVLTDPRVTLEFNDARNTLLVDDRKYDIIASQPSHPWLARASGVFTKDFFTIVKSRLNEGGIYGQWVNLFNMDVTTLRSIFRAFYDVFPYGVTFANLGNGDFLLFGSSHKLVFDYDQIVKRMAEPKIKAMLDWHGVYEPRDLFWYFSLSRDDAVNAAGDIPANTDTNILSEVRLSALDGNATGEEDPYKFIIKNYKLDIIPYLDGDVVNKLQGIADNCFKWDQCDSAAKIVSQMKKIDVVAARGIEYEDLWHRSLYESAFELYAQHDAWPDRTHYQQVVALAELGRFKEAKAVASRAKTVASQREAQAFLLYEQQQWQALSRLVAQTEGERRWQLLGVAQTNIEKAGRGMEEILQIISLDIPQYKLMVRFYSHINDDVKLQKYTRELVNAIDKKVKILSNHAEAAVNDNDHVRAERLLQKIVQLNYSWAGVDALRKKIEKLKKKVLESDGGTSMSGST